eukprot:gene5319-44623_t
MVSEEAAGSRSCGRPRETPAAMIGGTVKATRAAARAFAFPPA